MPAVGARRSRMIDSPGDFSGRGYCKLLALYLPYYAESKEWLRVSGGWLDV